MVKTFVVYMLASKPNGTLYIGVTSNLVARLWQHRPGDVIRFQVFRDDAVREVLVESADAEAFFA